MATGRKMNRAHTFARIEINTKYFPKQRELKTFSVLL